MAGGMPYGLQNMLKEGHKHLSGLDEAVVRNIEACKGLSAITRTSLGPNGMNKLIINHLERIFVTSDTATVVNELEVAHPAAKLIVMAAAAQQAEIGDGTNLVVTVAGELLSQAEHLIRDGLHPSEIADGYRKASQEVLRILDTLVIPGSDKFDAKSEADVMGRIRASVASKQYGNEDNLCPLIARACIDVCPKNTNNFNVDNVRVAKIPGGGIYDSTVVKGMVITRDAEGTIKAATDAKVVVFAQGIDASSPETKGTVLIRNAEELKSYAKSEEDRLERFIKGIAESGAKVVISGSTVGEMAMHFLEKYGLMVVKMPSKFELRRLCRATGCCALVKMEPPTRDELGFAKSIAVREIGGTKCIVLEQDSAMGQLATVVLRGATQQVLDDLERAVDDGVNAYRALCKDARTVPAGGATEIEIAKQLMDLARKETGLEQYAIQKFAEALEIVPRILAENSGLNATDAVSALWSAHIAGDRNAGLDIETGGTRDLSKDGYVDLYTTKWWALKLLSDAAVTVLKVDHIIMAKQAGGPKPRGGDGDDE